ncbi:MAG: S-layer homology domain-containing protein, partial [Clostridia bacterium]|nr:S-layer homology domain-containing protein [Clostridia bacterium]
MKKILSLVLAMVMVLGLIPAVFALEGSTASNPDYQEAIDFLATVGLYKGGVPADEDVTRWQMALFVSRFITGQLDDKYWEYTDEDKDSGFTDIGKLEAYQIGAVTFAAQEGIVVGVGENKFAPNDNVQYRDAITMIVRALGFKMKASQYPWGYINKATELGIIGDKAPIVIKDVAYTDAIAREIVAALLYNAFFAKVDGKTVAETTFGLGTDVVIITATEDAFYNYNDRRVTKSGYVEYASIDEQGEPVGQRYYNPIGQFGFANKAEATENIGNYFYVTYLDNKHEILDSKCLAEVYMNFGDEAQEVTNLYSGKLKIGDKTFAIVNTYSDLNYNQGYNNNNNEIKYYLDNGSSPYIGAEYYIGSDNNIYHVANPT